MKIILIPKYFGIKYWFKLHFMVDQVIYSIINNKYTGCTKNLVLKGYKSIFFNKNDFKFFHSFKILEIVFAFISTCKYFNYLKNVPVSSQNSLPKFRYSDKTFK